MEGKQEAHRAEYVVARVPMSMRGSRQVDRLEDIGNDILEMKIENNWLVLSEKPRYDNIQ